MAKRRPEGFDLRAAMRRREFTPSRTDVPALVALALSADEDDRKCAALALARVPELALADVQARMAGLPEAPKARLPRLLGGLPGSGPMLLALVDDRSSAVRRAAIQTLARVGGEGVEAALLARWPGEDAPERRALAMALGRVGGERAAELLRTVDAGDDAELARLVARARLLHTRASVRATSTRIVRDRAPGGPVEVELLCRSGLEPMLETEVRAIRGVRVRGSRRGAVAVSLTAAPAALDAARTWYEMRFPLARVAPSTDAASALADALASDPARALYAWLADGTPRVRIHWDDGRKRRALTWSIAEALDARGIVNDSHAAPFQAHVREARDGSLAVALEPSVASDPRFAYRTADVPASTHPTIAAAMARLCPTRPTDVVWDPFVGAGLELVERGLRGPFARLLGSDVEPRALDAARANLRGAGLEAELHLADATRFSPPVPPTVVVTNPPMGRRVHRGDVGPLLEAFLENVARVCARDATLVLLDPLPRRLGPCAERLGFRLDTSIDVDMGGFVVALERWVRR